MAGRERAWSRVQVGGMSAPMTRAERDRLIAEMFTAGITRGDIGLRFGITPRRVSQIAAECGAERPWTKITRRRPGAPRLVLPPDIAPLYAKVRRHYGARKAREMMGVGA